MNIRSSTRGMYLKSYRRMKPWYHMIKWVDKGYMKPHPFLPLFRMFDTNEVKILGGGQKYDKGDHRLYAKFLRKYPETVNQFALSPLEPENVTHTMQNNAGKFISRQKKYMHEGFTELRAFEMVERELADVLQTERYERSLFEGLATSNRSRSLLSYYEQEAEYESRQKVKRMERELPQFKRHQADLEKTYEKLLNEKEEIVENEDNKDISYKKYQPATCNLYNNS